MLEAPPWGWQHLLELGERGKGEGNVAFSSADPLPGILLPPVETPFGISYRKPYGKSRTSSQVSISVFGEDAAGSGFTHDASLLTGPLCGAGHCRRLLGPTRDVLCSQSCGHGRQR